MSIGVKRYVSRRAVRLLVDERGQDLIEYALLTGIIAIVAALMGPPLTARLKMAYENWNTDVQALSEPPPPLP
jgi:Flp pilus assembly pilin Flp